MVNSDIFSFSPELNRRNLSLAHTEFFCQLTPRPYPPHSSYTKNVVDGEFTSSTLYGHVDHVDFLRAQKEVRGVYARWVVTRVQHSETFGDLSVVQLPAQAMSEPRLNCAALSVIQPTVAVIVAIASPRPARIRLKLLNVRPEMPLQVFSFGPACSARRSTKLRRSSVRVPKLVRRWFCFTALGAAFEGSYRKQCRTSLVRGSSMRLGRLGASRAAVIGD